MRTSPTCMRSLATVCAVALGILTAASLRAQEPTHIEGLGSLSFPNSGAPEAQHDFLRGVLLLHSFEYEDAAEAFRAAQAADPDFAMAYWGEAMSYTHPVWNAKDAGAARAALARYAPTPRARAAKAPTERERGYLRAVDVLYGEGAKARLDTLYAIEMQALSEAYPDDLEARAFHALALLGLSQGDRDVPTYMRAGALALEVFEKNPEHPGGAHYTIHSFDDPTHAPLAMKAAEAYGPIAPDAAHAQHMTTHIFLALGMWDRVVEANERADAVVDRSRTNDGLPPGDCGHYNEWLMYGYQQQGRYKDAEALLMACHADTSDERIPEARRRSMAGSYGYMRSLFLADTEDWEGVPARTTVEMPGGGASALLQDWGTALVELNAGNWQAAVETVGRLGSADLSTSYMSPYLPVWAGTLEAAFHRDRGRLGIALESAREAAEYEASLPVDFGPPIAAKPARELEGEILLEMGRAEEAMAAFSLALGRTPNRVRSMLGHIRAAEAAGHGPVADRTRARLIELLHSADPAVLQMAGR